MRIAGSTTNLTLKVAEYCFFMVFLGYLKKNTFSVQVFQSIIESGDGGRADEPRLECGRVAAVSGAAVALGTAQEAGAAVRRDEKTNHKVV
jgi:hypothetical protein